MINFSRLGTQSDDSIFEKNEEQVNRIVCKGMAYAFWVFPVMLLLNAAGLFRFSESVVVMLAIIGTFCTLSPIVLSKFLDNQNFIKYYALICIIVLVSVLGTEYYVGIYITFIVAPIASCLYFDKKFTVKILSISYVGYLISYYFRCTQTRDILYPTETVWATYIPLAAGFTLEFIVSLIFLYGIADRAHFFLLKQKEMIAEMSKNEAKVQLAMEATTDILFEYDIKSDFYTSNGSIRGWVRKNVKIEHFMEYAKKIQWKTEDFVKAMKRFVQMPEEEGNRFQEEICVSFLEGGQEFPAWAYFEVNIIRDSAGLPETILGKIRDITEQKLDEIKAAEAKNYDTLTGMYHYGSLRKIVRESEGRTRGKTHQIMIINIKNYQEIAQSYGEVYRDFVIMNTAEVIKKNVQGDGILTSRLSDEVFLVYIEDCDQVDSRKIRQNLNTGLRNIYVGENKTNKLVYDFGYYLGEEHIDELFKVALRYVNANDAVNTAEFDNGVGDGKADFPVVSNGQTFHEIANAKKEEAGTAFIKNISKLLNGSKESRSAIQMSLARAGKFFALDGIRVYEFSESKERIVPEFAWAVSEKVANECDIMVLGQNVADFFVENFGRSRVVDNTIGAFQDFFRQFGENPLLLSEYSSLICPMLLEDKCRAVIIYDIREPNYTWSDEQKEHLLALSKVLGNVILTILADAAMREKHVFLANMSHEVRMPISAIAGITEIARTELNNPEKIKGCLDTIDESTNNLVNILNDILDLSKMEIGKMKFSNEIFSVEDVLAQVENQAVADAKVKEIEFHLERKFQENLLCGDEKRIAQVLIYLVRNAIKHVNQGGKVDVLVEELSNNKDVATLFFCVKDNGAGMTQEAIDKVFIAFEHNDSLHSEKHGDTGLALSVCYNVVRLMGGELEVKSEPGKGSEFFFTLKLEVPPEDNMLQFFKNKSEMERETVDLQDKTVLIAEDNAVNADIMRNLFERQGAKVLVANNGLKCVELYEKSKNGEIAFILMDVNMPILNGHETTQKIRASKRQDARKVPIIAMSANTFEEDVKESLAAGMDAHLMKPIQLKPLLQEVTKIVYQKKTNE